MGATSHVSAWRKLFAAVTAMVFALGLSFAATTAGSTAYAASDGSIGLMATGGIAQADDSLTITTEALPNGIVGEDYSFQLQATAEGSDTVTWEKVSGQNYVSVSESGVVSFSARSYWSSGTTVKVKATSSEGATAEKEFTFKILYKYKRFTGASKDDAVYASMSQEGKFVTSGGDNAGMLLNYVPVKLADLAKVDLDDYGMGSYKLASDGTGDYAYEVTYLQLMLYMHENYYEGGIENGFATGEWSSPGSLWVSKFWGVSDAYFTYGLNGQILIDEYGNMPTADTVALANGDDCAMNFYNDASWYGDSNTADHYYIDGDTVQHEADAFTGVEIEFSLFKVYSSNMDPAGWSPKAFRDVAADYPYAYGKAYGEAVGTGTTDGQGVAKVTFSEAGTWYIWADGIKGVEHPDKVVSAPAMVTVTVTDKMAPAITTESLPSAAQGVSYEEQLEAEGNPAEFKWALAEGSTLPEGLKLSEDGVVSGTPVAIGNAVFSVTCSNGVEPAATKQFTLTTLRKYKDVEGTAYITISEDATFAISDGENSNVMMWRVPISLADLAEIDLEEFGLEKFYLPAQAEGADYAYEITALQLMVYAAKHYSANPVIGTTSASTPRHVFFNKFFGYETADFMYNYNGKYPWDKTLGEDQGATADAIVLADGDSFNVWHFTESTASVWYGNGIHEFVDAEGAVAGEYVGKVGEPIEVAVTRTGIDYKTYKPGVTVPESGIITDPRDPESNIPYPIFYGRSYGDKTGELVLDEQGKAKIDFPEAGKWYVWLDGDVADMYGMMEFVESSSAMTEVVILTEDDITKFENAKSVAEQKAQDAETALNEAKQAAQVAKAAADAVDAAGSQDAKEKAADAAAAAAQVAMEKAEAAVAAANQAADAAQAALDAAMTSEQKGAASKLVSQANDAKTQATDAKTAADEAKAKADQVKASVNEASKVQVGKTYESSGMSYKVSKVASGNANGVVTLTKAKNAKSVTVPATIKLADGKTYAVDTIATKAFSNLKKLKSATVGANVKKIEASAFFKTPKLKKLIVNSKLLKAKSSVKGALKGSKAKKLTVKVPKKLKKAYKKSFSKKNLKAPKKVIVK